MAIQSTVDAETIALRYLAAMETIPGVREVRYSCDGAVIVFWIITGPIDDASERAVYEAGAGLYCEFPDSLFRFNLINPRYFPAGANVTDEIPSSARTLHQP